MLNLVLKNYLKKNSFFHFPIPSLVKFESFQNAHFTLFILKGPQGVSSVLLKNGSKKFLIEYSSNTLLLNNIKEISLKNYRNTLLKIFLNLIIGLSKGWTSYLKIKGFGFRSQIKKNKLILKLGFSHLNYFFIPPAIKIKRIKKNILKIFCNNLQKLNEVTFFIKKIRSPNAYRDKGISLQNEILKFKPGKKGKF